MLQRISQFIALLTLAAAALLAHPAEADAAYDHPLDKGPVSYGGGFGLAVLYDWGQSAFGERDVSVGGLSAHADLVWGIDPNNYWQARFQGASTLCIDHQSGTCPGMWSLGVMRGHTLRARWGHLSADYGVSAGAINPNHARKDLGSVPFVGLAGSAEAYFTPIPWVGVGVEVPMTFNHRHFGGAAMLSLKVGKIAPY